MGATNIALRHARWNELHELLKGSHIKNITPYFLFKHTHFIIEIAGFSYEDLNKLGKNGYEVTRILGVTPNHTIRLEVYKWDMEKMNEASRQFLATLDDKCITNYNLQIVKEELADERKASNELRQKNKQLEDQLQNLMFLRELPDSDAFIANDGTMKDDSK